MPTAMKAPVKKKEKEPNIDVLTLAILFSAYYDKLPNTEVAYSNAKNLLQTLKNHENS